MHNIEDRIESKIESLREYRLELLEKYMKNSGLPTWAILEIGSVENQINLLCEILEKPTLYY